MKMTKILSIVIAIVLMLGAFSVCTCAEENQSIDYLLTVNGETHYGGEIEIALGKTLEIQIADVTVNGQSIAQGEISYKWEKSCPAPEGIPGLMFEEIDGANESIYNVAYDGTLRYRCTVTVNGVGYRCREIWLKEDSLSSTGQSNKPIVFNEEDENYYIDNLQVGEEVTLTINANSTIQNAVFTYNWSGINGYIQPDSELDQFFEIADTSNSITVTKKAGQQSYTCEISDGNATDYIYFTLDSNDTITDSIQINGQNPGTYAGTYYYVTKPNSSVTISIPSTSTLGDVEYKWYYREEGPYPPARVDNTTNTITATKLGFTEENPYACEVYECYLEDGNERVRYAIMLFCLDPETNLSEIQKIGEETPNIEIKTQNEDLANTVLNGDELKALSEGNPIEVTLSAELKQTVSQAEKNAINEKLTDNSNVGMYLDINLFKGFEEDPSQVSELEKSIELSIDMPENLINKEDGIERKYSVVRVHNGVAETIPCTFDKTENKIAFSSDKFSTYTIVYTDTAINKPTDNTLENTQNNNIEKETHTSDKKETVDKKSPATSDHSAVGLWLFLIMVSGFAVITSLTMKKAK